MAKFRNAESYLGNTAGARKRQRANLIPGNTWQKRRTQEFRVACFWEYADPRAKQMIYENFENERNIKGIPKKELKDEKYIDNWWRELVLERKISIYKKVMSGHTKESRSEIFKDMEKCLKKKLEKGI